ncbi:polysaccharide lyase 6 family protein [Planctobacterium marinum]|uniref:polysaccharide lyase 6 family protein n=1 Tax=Planctobacterium marinum TaxID=1631968 RepID=UPI001E654ED3|nr:polysaccharide lyase 6 family protein [Planctobacterium marinum]MCC2605165.1 polysaccharide lyase 6 family protein [Planctobacterium marinum]
MKVSGVFFAKLCSVALLLMASPLSAKEYFIDTQQAFKEISTGLQPGDVIVLKNGTWQDFEILLHANGTKDAPIHLTAETRGRVILSGQSNLRLAGRHLLVSGLVFRDGYTPSSAVIEFRRNKDEFAYHSRVTEVVIDNYNNPDKQESDYWVAMYGQHNRFDHSHLVGKRNKGVTVAVRLNHENSQQNHHQIDHNYFGYRPTFGSNGGETLRIGTSHFSLTDSYTLVENNYFEQTNGEVEIISVKSGKNTLRGNVFYEAQGTLTMRHGNGNLIEKNVFIGNGVPHTGGIRIINKDQIVRNNYLEGLTGYRFGSGFTVMNGVPDSPINRYHQVDNARIENNTFVNVRHIQLAAGSDAERSAVPVNSYFKNNLIVNDDGQQPFTLFDDVSGIEFSGNVANTQAPDAIKAGINTQAMTLQRNKNGLLSSSARKIGAEPNLQVVSKAETGVTWYPKTPALLPFDSGRVIQVEAGAEALVKAIESAQSGDILMLSPGQYDIPRLIPVSKTLTIKGAQEKGTTLTYERSALFEIRDGGSLKLDELNISGEASPDAAGNAVVRTQKWGMVENYRLQVLNSYIKDLDINHSFHFFVTGKGAFADEITLQNNAFINVTGDILRLDTEIEDLGIYNAEYVNLQDNLFEDVQGALLKLYRGGTDESTFGPHLLASGNEIINVGDGKRNKTQASLYLHGVQVADLLNNQWFSSAPVKIEHTVGEPKTRITENTFIETPAPAIAELRVKGPHTAIVSDNQYDARP